VEKEEIIEKLRELLSEEFETDLDKIQPSSNLMKTLDLDSLDIVDVVVMVEKHFGFTMKKEDFKNINTFQDFYDFVSRKLA
jgi:acyl carrier protein